MMVPANETWVMLKTTLCYDESFVSSADIQEPRAGSFWCRTYIKDAHRYVLRNAVGAAAFGHRYCYVGNHATFDL